MPNSPSMAMMAINNHTHKRPERPLSTCRLYLVLPQGAPVPSAPRCANRGRSRRGPSAHLSPAFLEPLLPCGRLER